MRVAYQYKSRLQIHNISILPYFIDKSKAETKCALSSRTSLHVCSDNMIQSYKMVNELFT